MKEFTSAVNEVIEEDEREERIKALMATGKTRQEAEHEENGETYVAFMLDGREMHAYHPTDGQLIFMLATMGRGQTSQSRFASIINVMLESLRDDDKDYLESRLLTRNRAERLDPKKIEEIFEYLTEEWFARPTQPSSDSATPPPGGGPN